MRIPECRALDLRFWDAGAGQALGVWGFRGLGWFRMVFLDGLRLIDLHRRGLRTLTLHPKPGFLGSLGRDFEG